MFRNKTIGVAVYIIIISFFIFGCMNIKSSVGNKSVTNYFNKNVNERYRIGIDNYVFLAKNHRMELGCEIITLDPSCTPIVTSTASGLVFSSGKNSLFILTAAHFCKKNIIPGTSEEITGIAKDQERSLKIIMMDEKSDICLLMGPKYKNESFNQIILATEEPKIGDDVYTVASPNGIGGHGIRPVFTGKFAGCDGAHCMTTIPATFGSSGAGIYTKDGELITIVMAVTEGFENLILSPSQIEIHKFIININNTIDIYQY
tara:strand:+ start:11582 stop:12361 length:780 start_codon:yes stop_codon:yes gene_type:complete